MKAFFIAVILVIIGTAASAQQNMELAPIVMASGSSNFFDKEDAQFAKETDSAAAEFINDTLTLVPIAAGAPSAQPKASPSPSPTPSLSATESESLTAPAPSPSPTPIVKSSTRRQVEAAARRPTGPRFICRGTEPFWVLRIEQQSVSFDRAGEGLSQFSAPEAAPSENSALAVTNFVAKNEKSETISALVVDTQLSGGVRCTDGMQDQSYSHSVFVNRNAQIFDGCCWMER